MNSHVYVVFFLSKFTCSRANYTSFTVVAKILFEIAWFL